MAARLLQLAAQRSQAVMTAAQLLAPPLRQVQEAMLPSLPACLSLQRRVLHRASPCRHLPPHANDFLAAYALANPAWGKFGRLALFGHRFTARHCGSRGAGTKKPFFFLPKKGNFSVLGRIGKTAAAGR